MPRLSDIIAPAFYELHHGIKSNEHDEVWCKGGRGSTKSSFISIHLLLGIMSNPGANALVCRRYDNELRDSVYGQVRWAAGKLEIDHLWRFMVSPMQAVYIPTGQKIIFKGADNPLKIKSINLGSGYIKYAWMEEVDQFGGFEEVRNILQSLFRGENHKRTAFFSYNPPKSARSWVNQESKIAKPGRYVHTSDYRDVDPEWLGDRFIADAEHLQKTNEVAYRHEYLGEEVGTGLEVFNNIEIREIPDKEFSTFDKIRQGLDFGYAIDPLSFERMHYDAKKRHLYIFREEAGIGLSNRVLASRLTAQEKNETTIADSAEPKSIDELKNDYGVRVIGAKKGPGSIENGVNWLADLEHITIDPLRCPLAAREFVNYALEVRRDGEVMSRYPDKDNHCLVPETLIQTAKGLKRIDKVQAGDMVLTRKGYKPCTKAWKVFDSVPVYKMTTSGGKTVTGTASHKVYANGLFTRIDALRYGDVLLSIRRLSWLNQKLSFLKAMYSFAGPNRNEEPIKFITDAIKPEGVYTRRYGNRLMGQFFQGVISIIKTAIHSIMRLKTLNASMQWSMQKDTHGVMSESKNNQSILNQSVALRKSGMHQAKACNGIPNTPKVLFAICRLLKKFVKIAGKLTGQEVEEKQTDFVQTSASLTGEGNQAQMMLKDNALYVGLSSPSTNMRKQCFVQDHVLTVEEAGLSAVYDLTIDSEHEFFANGVLVHNSIDSVRYAMERDIGTKTMRAGRANASALGL